MPQIVQDCHLLVHVTSEVSDTPLSQPLTAVMQSPQPMTRQYILLTAIVRKWWCLYVYTYLLMLLYECPFILEASLYNNVLASIAANRTMRV